MILSLLSTQLSTQSSINSLIRMEVAQVVRDYCQCDFQESFISQGVLFCDEQEPTQIVYRANITSYESYSANQLVGYIEDWVIQGATITTGVFVVVFDPDCPVRISDVNDPSVCAQTSTSASIPTSTSPVTPTSTPSAPNTLAVVGASVSVVVLIFAVATVVIIILIIIILRKKKIM